MILFVIMIIRHEWFQNDAFVTIEVFIKNIKKDAVELGFFDKSVSLYYDYCYPQRKERREIN